MLFTGLACIGLSIWLSSALLTAKEQLLAYMLAGFLLGLWLLFAPERWLPWP